MEDTALGGERVRLAEVLEDCESVCVGYSGGVDSVFLAATAVRVLGRDRVLAVTGRSAAYPAVQHRTALECVERFGIPHLEVETRELDDPDYAANPSNRCYYCKSELWDRLQEVARSHGLRTVVDGSNLDDAGDHRPGALAGRERSVRSPLREAGLDKAAIRALSREMGLPTWDQPASPCLASRLTYGLRVTAGRLAQVEEAETLLRDRGIRELRVRHHGDAARIEVAAAELDAAAGVVVELRGALAGKGFDRVLLDVEGYRRGALNEGLVQLNGGGGERVSEVRSLLHSEGLDVDVTVAGMDGEIVAVRGDVALRERLAALAPTIRSIGFRYVALDPGHGHIEDEES